MNTSYLISLLLSIPAVLIALTVHEYAHGFAAYKLGDQTAKESGRLSLNPLRHLDPIGVFCMVLFHFGWARPVPIDPRNFEKPRRDIAITSICGPLANFILAFFGMALYLFIRRTLIVSFTDNAPSDFGLRFALYALEFLWLFHYLNLTLGLFNCIPIPPLDGSRVLMIFLPPKAYLFVMKYERFISLALLLLLYFGVFSGPLSTVADWLSDQMMAVLQKIPIFA